MPLRRSQFQRLLREDPARLGFTWATGIEDTFVTEPWPATGRTLDEYELTGHYAQWRRDVELIAGLGVPMARYGIPWHRVNPADGQWDWQWADGPLNRLVELGVDPVVDLVHYGTPAWIDGAFVNPSYPALVADYARRVAERFSGKIHCYTPLNEPRITAWYCGRLGWWPPHLHGERGFLRVMLGVCRGIVLTVSALREVDPEAVVVHVDATDLFEAATPDLAETATQRQRIVFLALDLILGRLGREHPLWDWCIRRGAGERDLMWFVEHPVEIDICGINLYPMFSRKVLRRERDRSGEGLGQTLADGANGSAGAVLGAGAERDGSGGDFEDAVSLAAGGRVRIRMPYSSAEIVDRLVRAYYERYQLPIMITETASRGPVARRMRWLRDCVEAVRRCRAEGLPLIGYTWWPMFALVAWAYRQGMREPAAYLEQMGLWGLAQGDGGALDRVATPLVDAYRELAMSGAEAAGLLAAATAQPEGRQVSRKNAL